MTFEKNTNLNAIETSLAGINGSLRSHLDAAHRHDSLLDIHHSYWRPSDTGESTTQLFDRVCGLGEAVVESQTELDGTVSDFLEQFGGRTIVTIPVSDSAKGLLQVVNRKGLRDVPRLQGKIIGLDTTKSAVGLDLVISSAGLLRKEQKGWLFPFGNPNHVQFPKSTLQVVIDLLE